MSICRATVVDRRYKIRMWPWPTLHGDWSHAALFGTIKESFGESGRCTLQANEEIKQPHAPFDGETLSFISRQDGVHSGSDLEHFGRIEKHFHKRFATVPAGADNVDVNIHHTVNAASVAFEQARLARFVIQNLT